MTADNKLIEKLIKIKNQAEGEKAVGNEAAAANMAALLQRLLAEHRISMTQLDPALLIKDEPITQRRVMPENHEGMTFKRKRVLWAEQLAMIVAKAHGCSILVTPGTNLITFVGRETSIQVCEYIFVTLFRTAEKVCDNEYVKFYALCQEQGDTSLSHGFKAGWLDGFCGRIRERFEAESRVEGSASSSALALFQKDALAVREYLDKKKVKMADPLSARDGNDIARGLGRQYANNVNLKNNAVTGSAKPNGSLKG